MAKTLPIVSDFCNLTNTVLWETIRADIKKCPRWSALKRVYDFRFFHTEKGWDAEFKILFKRKRPNSRKPGCLSIPVKKDFLISDPQFRRRLLRRIGNYISYYETFLRYNDLPPKEGIEAWVRETLKK